MARGKKSSSTKWIIIGLIGILIIVIAVAKFAGGNTAPEVETETAELSTIVASVSEAGTIQPVIEVNIAPDVSGEVVELPFKEGDYVKKGDLLAVIRPDNYQSAVEQSRASVNSAIANYEQAKAALAQAKTNMLQDSINYFRNKKLYEEQAISKAEFENFKLAWEVSKSNVSSATQQVQAAYYQAESARASLKQAQQNLMKTSIFASMDGTITLQNVELGERVVGTMQMAGTEMLKIADLNRMQVVVDINENDIIKISRGDSAEIEVDAYPDRKFTGKVIEIAYSANVSALGTTDQVTSFEVSIEIDSSSYSNDKDMMANLPQSQGPFRPGMSAQVEIFTETHPNVLAVPIQAVIAESEKVGKEEKFIEYVYVVKNGVAEKREVTTGASDDRLIEIKSGLQAGDVVISGPYIVLTDKLKDGDPVEIKKKEDKKKKKKDADAGSEEKESKEEGK